MLWEEERALNGADKKQSFVDLGCGNGLLVFILSSEGVSVYCGSVCDCCYYYCTSISASRIWTGLETKKNMAVTSTYSNTSGKR